MSLQRDLKLALLNFLETGNESNLASLILKNPSIISTVHGTYPDLHRICDICIERKCFRVCRQISANEALTLSSIDEALTLSGVPVWLEGEKLRAWAKEEVANPADEPTNWEAFR